MSLVIRTKSFLMSGVKNEGPGLIKIRKDFECIGGR